MTDSLQGKTALVTGAARGLGLLVAHDLAGRGMNVIGADVRNDELARSFAGLDEEFDAEFLARATDLRDEDQVKTLVAAGFERFGRIDVLVNNAGLREIAPIWETPTDLWDRVLGGNLRGQFLCTREVLAQGMLEKNEGTIIFVSAIAGKQGSPNSCAYAASKWGILGLSHSVAKDLEETKIRVTAITPGRIETPMARESEAWAMGLEWLDPKAVSQAIVFCIEQDADTIIPELHIIPRAQI